MDCRLQNPPGHRLEFRLCDRSHHSQSPRQRGLPDEPEIGVGPGEPEGQKRPRSRSSHPQAIPPRLDTGLKTEPAHLKEGAILWGRSLTCRLRPSLKVSISLKRMAGILRARGFRNWQTGGPMPLGFELSGRAAGWAA